MKTLLSDLRGANCKGSAIRFPKPSLGHRVLVREKAIVGIETELMPTLHGSREQHASSLRAVIAGSE